MKLALKMETRCRKIALFISTNGTSKSWACRATKIL